MASLLLVCISLISDVTECSDAVCAEFTLADFSSMMILVFPSRLRSLEAYYSSKESLERFVRLHDLA